MSCTPIWGNLENYDKATFAVAVNPLFTNENPF